jgi:hypothetical protein
MKRKILGLVAAGLLGGPMAANATLIGDTVGCGITPSLWACSASSAVVGAGNEFSLLLVGNARFGVDIGANSVTLTFLDSNELMTGAGELLTLSGLDFSGGHTITGISNLVFSGVSVFDLSWITYTGNSVAIRLSGTRYSPGAYVSFDLLTNAVPEPGSLGLLGVGFAALGLTRRRKAH